MNPLKTHLALFMKQSAMRLACHKRVGKALSIYYKDRIPNRSCIIETSHEAITDSLKASLYWGVYETSEVLFVDRYLRSDLDVIELGSSIGVVSSHIAQKLSSERRLICVEANPQLISVIQTNIKNNAPNLRINVLHGAIDYSDAKVITLDIGGRNIDSKITKTGKNLVPIPVLTLGEVCNRYHVEEFCLVCDIEGSEWGMLQNEAEVLNRCRQVIIELHHTKQVNKLITIDDLVSIMVYDYKFTLVQQRGNVYLFEH